MNDVDRRIRAELDRAVSTAPPPVSIETIVARNEPALVRDPRRRRWTRALPALAAAMALMVLVTVTNEPGPEAAVELEATDTPQTTATQPPPSAAAVETEITIRSGIWLSETIPHIADQLPNITANQLWAALDQTQPRPPFTATASDLDGVDVPGLSDAHLRWEGLLPPGTYSIDSRSNATDVIDDLHDEFTRTLTDLNYDQASDTLGLTAYEIVIVASLVETADPANEDDRAKIATVIHNRLAQGLPIGLDAAYLYAAQDRDLALTSAVLETQGPYGLRTAPGLPPTPIAAPSRASLLAAIEPTPGPWLFYVIGDDQGRHYFATTLAEHSANVDLARANGVLD